MSGLLFLLIAGPAAHVAGVRINFTKRALHKGAPVIPNSVEYKDSILQA